MGMKGTAHPVKLTMSKSLTARRVSMNSFASRYIGHGNARMLKAVDSAVASVSHNLAKQVATGM